jgi:hypothetical protein
MLQEILTATNLRHKIKNPPRLLAGGSQGNRDSCFGI